MTLALSPPPAPPPSHTCTHTHTSTRTYQSPYHHTLPHPQHNHAQVRKADIVSLQAREETGFGWQDLVYSGFIECASPATPMRLPAFSLFFIWGWRGCRKSKGRGRGGDGDGSD